MAIFEPHYLLQNIVLNSEDFQQNIENKIVLGFILKAVEDFIVNCLPPIG